jgi:hypothetical protein
MYKENQQAETNIDQQPKKKNRRKVTLLLICWKSNKREIKKGQFN